MATNGKSNARTNSGASRGYTGPSGRAHVASDYGANAWHALEPTTAIAAITELARIGGAVLCGATQDGGAAAITVFYSDQRIRFYPRDTLQLAALLEYIHEWATEESPEFGLLAAYRL
jgi:hypothetical protein